MGILGNVPLSDAEEARLWGALMQGLRELGYVEGQNLIVEHLSTEGRSERLPALAIQLARWKPDVIVAPSNSNALEARKATQTIRQAAGAAQRDCPARESRGHPLESEHRSRCRSFSWRIK